jgi:hypothetical protein
MGGEFAGSHIEAVHVKVAISKPAIGLVELGEGCGLIGFQLGDPFLQHGFGLGCGACCWLGNRVARREGDPQPRKSRGVRMLRRSMVFSPCFCD